MKILRLLLGLVLLSGLCSAQTAVVLAPIPRFTQTDNNGVPLAFGCVFSYISGTSTPLQTYVDYTGTTLNANPVVLSGSGTANIWLLAGQAYRLRVKSSGGVNCASGSQLYTVDGIGGGLTTLTTNVTFSTTPTFTIAAQNQLFEITLTGNATSNPLTGIGVTPPAFVAFEITQDGSGGHTFSWPANSVGGCTIGAGANQTTVQFGHWDGSKLYFDGPCVTGNGPIVSTGNLFDYGLTASSTVCTDANKQLVSAGSCATANGITVNGQAIPPGGSGNVNVGASTHSVALNQGNGNPLTGLTLAANQIAVGATSADPTASTLPTCASSTYGFLTFSGTLPITCPTVEVVQASSITILGGSTPIAASPGNTNVIVKSVTMPSSGCPCRAFVSYQTNNETGNSGNLAYWVSDGTNTFATSSSNTTGAVNSGATFSVTASSYSTGTYANGASVTFTLIGSQNMNPTGVNALTSNNLGGQNSWMNVAIFTSN